MKDIDKMRIQMASSEVPQFFKSLLNRPGLFIWASRRQRIKHITDRTNSS